jgi:predicted glycogen debranching enzyme
MGTVVEAESAAAEAAGRRTILDEPHVAFGREICGDLNAGLRREWLVTNGLGGYASASLAGVLTRSYHGLLVAALEPPVARRVLVAALVATYDGRRVPPSTHEFGGEVFTPAGYRHLESFRLEGTLPVWTFAVADALVERRLWMPHGQNTTYVSYRLTRASRPLDLELTSLVTDHDFHALRAGAGWAPLVDSAPHGVLVRADERSVAVRLLSDRAAFQPGGAWW